MDNTSPCGSCPKSLPPSAATNHQKLEHIWIKYDTKEKICAKEAPWLLIKLLICVTYLCVRVYVCGLITVNQKWPVPTTPTWWWQRQTSNLTPNILHSHTLNFACLSMCEYQVSQIYQGVLSNLSRGWLFSALMLPWNWSNQSAGLKIRVHAAVPRGIVIAKLYWLITWPFLICHKPWRR